MKKVAILQSNYIPWKGYFDLINTVDEFIIYDEVQYTKNDWRNRNLIKTRNGCDWITIPVKQDSLSQKIFETKVAFNNWNIKHWKTLQSAYSKAPHFVEFKNQIWQLYSTIDTSYLSEINLLFIKEINKILKIKTIISDSRTLDLTGDRNERLVEAVLKVGGTHYLSGPAAKSYLNLELFKSNNIDVQWMDYSNYRIYNQLFPPFVHTVTILDLIFNEGGDSLNYICQR
jgi:hypothetical protein